jgi:opacity protein-like surface antigen
MMHGRMKSRLLASALAAVLAPAAIGATYAAPLQAQAAEVKEATCQVHAVLASKEGEGGIPDKLRFLEAQLNDDEFAAYKSFHLIEQKALSIKLGVDAGVTLTTGNRLGLSLLGNDDTRLKLRATLSSRDGSKSLLSTDYSMEDAGVLMIRAGSYAHEGIQGKLFVAIQCARSG